MNRLRQISSWMTSALLVFSTCGLDACGSNKSAPVTVTQAQTPDPQAQAAPAQGQAAPADTAQATQLPQVNFTADGLDELLAPIALYPDPVLAVMLQAAVNPQEVMDGGNWLALDENQNLKEAALDQASQKAGFTPVTQALLHYPTVVDLMCTQFDWTKQLGAAYQGNPKAVLESVQRLRAQAVDNGALKSSPQMKVNVTQDQGQQVVKLEPGDSKTVYVPQYDPDRVYQTTTTTTSPNGTTTTTTTTNSPASASSGTSSSSSTTTAKEEKSGVSTGTAVLIGLLSFGAGIAVGAAINNNNYYYPAWGYGGVWYGPRPYYPPPYHPVYYGGWHGGGYYNRPVHYGNTNIYVNNTNNYYNRFNHNTNLNTNYKPRPVQYNNNPNGVYAKSMGNRPATRQQGATYQPRNNNLNTSARPATGNVQARPGNAGSANVGARPAQPGNNAQNWKGQSTYHGRTTAQQPIGGAQNRPGGGANNAGANNRGGTTQPARNPSGDRGFGQPGGSRPSTGNAQYNRPNTQAHSANQPATRPSTQQTARPAQQQVSRPQNSGGAFNGASSPKNDRAASNRGHASMGAHAERKR